MRILLTGRAGQVGWELERALPALGELIGMDRSTLDLSDVDAIRRVAREAKPALIVNAAAYTAVDRAEFEPDLAMQVNGVAPGVLAEEAKRLGALLVHYSTDYVFDGEKRSPYVESDCTNPVNVYGRTKLEGERRIAASGCRYLILRTSWVYGSRGRNFLLAILNAAREKRKLRVVNDQVGAPTSSLAMAQATVRILEAGDADGLYHMSAAGRTTWFDFAKAIVDRAAIRIPVVAITSDEYPAKARRPRNSLLDNAKLRDGLGIRLADWSSELDQVMTRLRKP